VQFPWLPLTGTVNSNVDSHLAAVKELYNTQKKWGIPKSIYFDQIFFNFMRSMCLFFKLIKLLDSTFNKFCNTKEMHDYRRHMILNM